MDDALTVAKYENYIKRRTAESWTLEQENILQMWAEKASGWAWLHDKSARYYDYSGNKIMYPNIIIGTFAGGLGLVSTNLSSQTTSRYINIFVACTNILCASLTSLNKYLRSNEKAEIHIHMNKLFSAYSRKIVLELSLNPESRRDAIEFCKLCRDEYDKLVSDSILIPSLIVEMYKEKHANAKYKPEVCNGLIHFTNYNRVSHSNKGDSNNKNRENVIDINTPGAQNKRRDNFDINDKRSSIDVVNIRRLTLPTAPSLCKRDSNDFPSVV